MALIDEDYSLVRERLWSMLEGEPGVLVLTEVGDGQWTLVLSQEMCQDQILMNVRIPKINGSEVTCAIT